MTYALLTTVERVKRRGSIKTDDDDQLLEELIAEVSADAEDYIGRHIQSTLRTESYRITQHEHVIALRGYPVASVASVKVHSRNDDWANVAVLDTTLWVLDDEAGTIYIRTSTEWSPTFVQVIYTGGFVTASGNEVATITNNFVASYPHVAGALDQEVVERLRRRKRAAAGQIVNKGAMVQMQTDIGLLRHTRRLLRFLKPARIL